MIEDIRVEAKRRSFEHHGWLAIYTHFSDEEIEQEIQECESLEDALMAMDEVADTIVTIMEMMHNDYSGTEGTDR